MIKELGELISVPVVGYMVENFPYIPSIILILLFSVVGGTLCTDN